MIPHGIFRKSLSNQCFVLISRYSVSSRCSLCSLCSPCSRVMVVGKGAQRWPRWLGQTAPPITDPLPPWAQVCRDSVAHSTLKPGRPRPLGRWLVALSCCASNLLRSFAPFGLPSFPSLRSADAYGPASSFGPARFACVRFAHRGGRCHVQPSLLTPSPCSRL